MSTQFFGLPTEGGDYRQKAAHFTSFVDKSVDRQEDTALALLGFLSDNNRKQAQFNAIFYWIDKNGPGGI
ncbi:MAG TPA: hypothetical protein VFZ67_04965 [Nitrososphaera sp.]